MILRSLFVIGTILLAGLLYTMIFRDPLAPITQEIKNHSIGKYPLFDPQTAPANVRAEVMRGYYILLETKHFLPDYAGDRISCTNCHFSAGNTFGGRHNGLSLVGVTHEYPKTSPSGKPYTLAERINACFLRSLNGKALPLDSPEMKAMLSYLEWISSGIPKLSDYPWMGTKKLRSSHIPDAKRGEKVYALYCSICHGKEGQGQERPDDLSYPPLWGENSFNDAAGMNKVDTFAYFVYENMPYDEPKLTVEDALDVAAFVTSQERPQFVEKQPQ